MSLPLRAARGQDAPRLAEVFAAAWRTGYRGIVPEDVIDTLNVGEWTATLGRIIAAGDRITVVAGEPPIGFVTYGPDEEPGYGYLASLYVHPEGAGAGVGSRLLRHALASMPNIPVRLWVFEGNAAARRLYDRAGFRPDGQRLTDPRWRVPQIRLCRPTGPVE